MASSSIKPSIFIRRPILSSVISIIITLCGAISIKMLPIAQYPDLVPPTVMVDTSYPGASAETIATTVNAPLEEQINGVENMLYMTSTASSGDGSGAITVYFALGSNPDMALVNVNNKVNLAQSTLPQTVRDQGVTVSKSSPTFLQIFALHSPDGRYNDVYLHNYLKLNIIDELKRIEGVGDAKIFGAADYAMRIWLDPSKMAKYGVTVSEVAAAVADQNAQFAPGRIGAQPASDETVLTWQIDALGRLPDPAHFENIILRTGNSSSKLLLKDVARVELGAKDYSVDCSYNGRPARAGGVWLLPGANSIATGERVTKRLEEIRRNFPEGMELQVFIDTNEFVLESIKEVVHTLGEAMVLVFLVVFVFLQNWRATIIPCIAVPVSIIGTFAGMLALGYTINTLTLFGLVLAIGIVVDDAIVVLENVERIMSTEHLPPREATAKAMHEVTSALIAIVLVLCSVFIPVSFMGGLAGQMYKQFAITISVSVVLSGIVALTLTPALCALLLKENEGKPLGVFRAFNAVFDKCTNVYVGAAKIVLAGRGFSFIAFCGVLAGLAFVFQMVPTSLVPDEDQGYSFGAAILDDGASTNRVRKVAEGIVADAMKDPMIEDVTAIYGYDLLSSSAKANYATFFFNFRNWSERKKPGQSDKDFNRRVMAQNFRQPSGAVIGYLPPPISGMSTAGGFEGYLQSTGSDDLHELEAAANRLMAEVAKRPEIAGAHSLFSTGSPLMYANLDRERCKDMGVSVSDVFTAMQGMFGTYYVNDFNMLGRTFQVRLQGDRDYRMTEDSLKDVYVKNKDGKMIPLSALIVMERRTAPSTVDRYNVFPAAHFMGSPAPGYTTGQALAAIEETAKAVLPAGYSIGWAGTSLQEKLASSDTSIIFVLALVMVFLILSAQYESWSLPLAVLTAVPFAILGATVATWLRGLSNDVYFQVALVTLIGLAAKNAILIVEFAADAWRGGMGLLEAAVHASRLRFRPIVMTSLAFILGVVPLAISTGAGANSRHAIGTAVIGGMLFATCIATLFIPFFFREIMNLSLRLRGKRDPNAGGSGANAERSANA